MNTLRKTAIAVCVVLLGSILMPAVNADSNNTICKTSITFQETVRVGDLTLSPGTYEFRLSRGSTDRSLVKIYNMDTGHWEGYAMGIRVDRKDHPGLRAFTLEQRGSNGPAFLRYWFYPDRDHGIEFVSYSAYYGA